MIGRLKLPFRRIIFWARWCRQAELLEAGALIALAPRPPDRQCGGEAPKEFRARVRHLVVRYTSPPETPEWMLPANVDEFLARTEPRD